MATSNVSGAAGAPGMAGTLGSPDGLAGIDGGAASGIVDYVASFGPFNPITVSQATFALSADGGKGGGGGAGYSDLLGSHDGAGGAGGDGGGALARLTHVAFDGPLGTGANGNVLLSAAADGGDGGASGANGLTGPAGLASGAAGDGGAGTAQLDNIVFHTTQARGAVALQALATGGHGGDAATLSGTAGPDGDGGAASALIQNVSLTGAPRDVSLTASAAGGDAGVDGDGGDASAIIRNSVFKFDTVHSVDVTLLAAGGAGRVDGSASVALTGNEFRLGSLAGAGSELHLQVTDFRELASLDISGNIFDGGINPDVLSLNTGSNDAFRFDMSRNIVTGFELIESGDGDDVLIGDAKNNTFQTNGGDDNVDGGAGLDTLTFDGAHTDYAITRIGDANYTIHDLRLGSPDGTDTVLSVEQVQFSDGLFYTSLLGGGVMVEGIAWDDKINPGSAPPGQPKPGALDDVIDGESGNDTIDGGAGADIMYGGSGSDTYIVDNVRDLIIETANNGTELVKASVTYSLAANLENLTLTGTDAINGTGNDLANTLTGNTGDNVLYGLDGKDVLVGGLGNDVLSGGAGGDTLTGGAGADHFVFDVLGPAADKDTIKDFVHGTDHLDFADDAFTALVGGAGGVLLASEFTVGTAATTAGQHLIYTSTNGALYYDADGVGGAAQVQIAVLTGHPGLTAADILVV